METSIEHMALWESQGSKSLAKQNSANINFRPTRTMVLRFVGS